MPDTVPRKSATVMLLRDGPGGIEVFMVVRHDALAFAAGALVFPGGSLDSADHDLAQDLARCPPIPGPIPPEIHVAAIRETFEETGILLARNPGTAALLPAARLPAIDRATPFHAMLRAEDLVLAPDRLVPFAHWITPAGRRLRFDTLFFLAEAPIDQLARHDGTESVHSIWITPDDAIAATASGTYKMVFPTRMNLLKLARHPTVADALATASRTALVTVLPELVEHLADGARRMRLPADAGYGGTLFDVDLPSSTA